MALSNDERDIPSPPGRLSPIDEDTPTDLSIHNVMDPSGAVKPVLRACKCKVCARSPILSACQSPAREIVGCHEVESTSL